ncbi:MAG: hypothetical protein ABIA37_04005 [Candidatus Woesearchaeota archaeon]
MVFGLGTTEILLIGALVLALIGPKGVKQIKPFFKSMYKAYLQYNEKVKAGQAEFNDITGEFKKELEDVKAEAERELRPEIDKLREEVETSRKDIEQGQQGFLKKMKSFNQDFRQEFDKNKQQGGVKMPSPLAGQSNQRFGMRGINGRTMTGKPGSRTPFNRFNRDNQNKISIRTKPDDLTPLKATTKPVPKKTEPKPVVKQAAKKNVVKTTPPVAKITKPVVGQIAADKNKQALPQGGTIPSEKRPAVIKKELVSKTAAVSEKKQIVIKKEASTPKTKESLSPEKKIAKQDKQTTKKTQPQTKTQVTTKTEKPKTSIQQKGKEEKKTNK